MLTIHNSLQILEPLSCIAEHGQCQSMAWLGVDTVIHSALARELTEYSNLCLHMCLTLKRDKTDTNIEYTFTEILFTLSYLYRAMHMLSVRYFYFDIIIWTHTINNKERCIAPLSTGEVFFWQGKRFPRIGAFQKLLTSLWFRQKKKISWAKFPRIAPAMIAPISPFRACNTSKTQPSPSRPL